VPRRQYVGAEVLGNLHQIDELDALVAGNAGHGGLALPIGIGERLHHRVLEPLFVVEHVMGDVERRCHPPCIVDILPGAAGALPVRCLAMIVKLQGDAHDVVALASQQAGDHGGIHAARHCDDNARVLGALGNIKRIQHLSHPDGFKVQRKRALYSGTPRRSTAAANRDSRRVLCYT
jgi:hypothetical protein